MVRQLAYEIFMYRMEEGLPGDACSDWYQAEKELDILTSTSHRSLSLDPALP